MEPTVNYDLVGGITAVVLYPTTASLPDEPTTDIADDGDGVSVAVDLGASSYVESLLPEGVTTGALNYTVKHTLTIECRHDESPFDDALLSEALNRGVVADVTLATGATIRVGWSDRYGVDYPLRMVSSTFDSGTTALDYPLNKWVLESVDQSVLL